MFETAIHPGLHLDHAWKAGRGPRFTVIDPARQEAVFAADSADAAQVQSAVDSAARAGRDWAARPAEARAATMLAYAERLKARAADLAACITREMGKARWEADAEVQAMIGKVALSIRAREARAGARVEDAAFGRVALDHRPWGVMAVLGPFNFPGHLPNGHIVPALLAGNAVVFKPSERAPGAALHMAAAFEEAGLPPGVLNLVLGGRETGEALLDARGVNGVLFTGSAHAGTSIHARFAGRPDVILALEMGGNNPLIVTEPADPEAAADIIVHSAFITTGQRCSCARRLFLPAGGFGDRVLAAVADRVAAMRVAPGDDPEAPFIGPLVDAAQARRMQDEERAWIAQGGRAVVAARYGDPGPAFVRPGLVDMSAAVPPGDAELFAPCLQLWRVRDLDEAVARANDTRFGLSAGVVTDDADLWQALEPRLRAGLVNWNRPTTGAASSLPFGGPGLSGNGRPSAWYAADYCAWPVARQEAPRAERLSAPGLPARA